MSQPVMHSLSTIPTTTAHLTGITLQTDRKIFFDYPQDNGSRLLLSTWYTDFFFHRRTHSHMHPPTKSRLSKHTIIQLCRPSSIHPNTHNLTHILTPCHLLPPLTLRKAYLSTRLVALATRASTPLSFIAALSFSSL